MQKFTYHDGNCTCLSQPSSEYLFFLNPVAQLDLLAQLNQIKPWAKRCKVASLDSQMLTAPIPSSTNKTFLFLWAHSPTQQHGQRFLSAPRRSACQSSPGQGQACAAVPPAELSASPSPCWWAAQPHSPTEGKGDRFNACILLPIAFM